MTVGPATAWDTVLYAGDGFHPQTKRYIHVLGFQNRVINDFHRANAVLLPVPAGAPLGPENLLQVPEWVLEDRANAIRQMDPNRALALPRVVRGGSTVQRGRYSVAIASRVSDALEAIETLPPEHRPPVDRAALAAYAKWYEGWPLVIGAWTGRMESEPLVLWYEPLKPQRLFLPSLVAPAGGVPRPLEAVPWDHALLIGSSVHPFGVPVRSRDLAPVGLESFLPPLVWGKAVKGQGPNVDYEVEVGPLRQLGNVAGKYDLHARLDPKLWAIGFEPINPMRR